MITYWSKSFIPTARQVPADALVPSHRLMLRAGCIHQLGSGIYDYLPLGMRALRKASEIVRQEMDHCGAIELLLPVLQPIELWEKTGRRTDYGDNLFVVKDRHGREQALGPTHEEVMTSLVGSHIDSYKQLPITLYQIQTKFRDEFRPRFGVVRTREFLMKDAYSFDLTLEGLDKSYQAQYDAYCRIFKRCGLPYEIVEAESGPIGGSASHEFMVPTDNGEDTILKSDKGNYAANVEKCETGPREHNFAGDPTGDLETINTPHCPGIDDVCAFFKKKLGSKLKTSSMLKSLVFCATRLSDNPDPSSAKDPWYILAIVRGDHDVNVAKLNRAVEDLFDEPVNIAMAPEDLARQDGWAIGFVGPHAALGRDDAKLVVDPDAAASGFWVTGANQVDHHIKHFNWTRDLLCDGISESDIRVADIRNAIQGDPSPKIDGGILQETKGVEIGHVFKLGTKYTDALDVKVLDENNDRRSVLMGCYGIGVSRILASAIECHGGHDDNGIIWPVGIAPFSVIITPIKYDGEVKEVVDKLAVDLEATAMPGTGVGGNIDVLIDDRDERPGVKFKDADLIGIPLRITVGDKGLKDSQIEIKARRSGSETQMVPVSDAVARVAEILATI
jgi:prolyl-tRNA synthetase